MNLYCDLLVDGATVFTGMVCLSGVVIGNYSYLGFQGGLVFYDTQDSADPQSPGLGTRFILSFIDPTGELWEVPINDVFAQQFSVILFNQNCTINLYQK